MGKLKCVGPRIYGALNPMLRLFNLTFKTSGVWGNVVTKGTTKQLQRIIFAAVKVY